MCDMHDDLNGFLHPRHKTAWAVFLYFLGQTYYGIVNKPRRLLYKYRYIYVCMFWRFFW